MIKRNDDLPEIIISGAIPIGSEVEEIQPQDAIIPVAESIKPTFQPQNVNFKKTSDQIRRGFMSRLTYDRIWLTPSEKPKMVETAIIFDWDDTILCTSFINPTGVFNPNQKIDQNTMKQIKLLEIIALKILELSVKHGKTYIITNAGEGWVQFSAKKFMPSLVPVLQKIKIISARA